MKRKYLSRFDWKRIEKREDKEMYINQEDFIGNIHLIKMIKVSDVLVNTKFSIPDVIVNNNYSWMSMLHENDSYVVTGQFDDKNNLIQIYIDIINNYGKEGNEIYFDDIYLDVILNHNKEVLLDDEDELKEALEENDITKEEYDRAYRIGIDIFEDVKANPDKWISLVEKYRFIIDKSNSIKKLKLIKEVKNEPSK